MLYEIQYSPGVSLEEPIETKASSFAWKNNCNPTTKVLPLDSFWVHSQEAIIVIAKANSVSLLRTASPISRSSQFSQVYKDFLTCQKKKNTGQGGNINPKQHPASGFI